MSVLSLLPQANVLRVVITTAAPHCRDNLIKRRNANNHLQRRPSRSADPKANHRAAATPISFVEAPAPGQRAQLARMNRACNAKKSINNGKLRGYAVAEPQLRTRHRVGTFWRSST